jgi:hypothetical protein
MKRYLGSLVLLCLLSCPCSADEPKAAPLSKQEIADGWILLFDGETTFGWNVEGEAKVADGILYLGGDKETRATVTTEFGPVLDVSYEARLVAGDNGKFVVQGNQNHGTSGDLLGNQWKTTCVRWTCVSDGIRGQPCSDLPIAKEANTPADHSLILGVEAGKGSQVALRRLKVKPLGMKPLFNGTDLTGWKEFKGGARYKSRFSVTPEGWINVKDGPGDLQTEGQWADFIVQLDCISNGKQLNSGIFVRARPGKYQQGYEAQIHNGYTDEPKKEYALRQYDPKTHELQATKRAKYTAIDYGTGGIYGQQPARRELSKDHEWFTMTVVAHGNHLATWVNGIQAVDWTDNRPVKDNARDGCCVEKGAISIQGHDPATDLNFRNLRLAELPKKKD